jgi:hypothetical protein
MAKTFGGFTPQQQQTLLSKMGYTGPAQQDDLNKFMMSSPKAASMMGKYAQMAKARVAGGPTVGMAAGGIVPWSTGEASGYEFGGKKYSSLAEAQQAQAAQANVTSSTPTPNTTGGFDMSETASTVQTQEPTVVYDPTTGLPTYRESLEGVTSMPEELTYDPDSVVAGRPGGFLRRDKASYVTLSDGTVISTKEGSTAEEVAAVKRMAEEAIAKRNAQIQDYTSYNTELDQYKQYQAGQAGAGLDDTRAALDTAQRSLAQEQNLLRQYTSQLAGMDADDPQRSVMEGLIEQQKVKTTNADANLAQAQTNVERVGMPSTTEMRADILDDPMSMVTKADVVTVSDAQREAGKIDEGVGQAATEAEQATATEAAIAGDVPLAQEFEAAGMTAKEAASEVSNVMSKLTAVTGKPSAEALAEAATMDPAQLAQLGLTVEQIDRAQRVERVARLEVTPEMQVSSAVDFERAKAETNFAAATGVPSTEATVQGQLTGLLEQFEGGETPPWAAGAMRAATATLAARGLGASSMAGQAVVQAAMESAMPIAMADAQTRASFEAQNLSNRQQAAMFAAEQRSKFLGMEFDQEFQSRVQNAARIADVAQINFSAEQQVALENARMAQTVDITNLSAKNAKIMADAAAMSQLDLTNLNNRQQANIQNAKAFLDFDMSSMNNQQQVAMFKAQSLASVFMSDTAAENASRQFNASSANQVDMFFSNLQTQIQQFNNEQSNAMERFNAGELNAISQFNAAQQNAREQFNANNALVVEQANAQWEQSITTMENAAQNAANRDAAMAANNLTETTYNNMLQQERDMQDYAFRAADNALSRENNLLVAEMQRDSAAATAKGSAAGKVAAVATDYLLNKTFGVPS